MKIQNFLIATILTVCLFATFFSAEARSAPAPGASPSGWQQMPGNTEHNSPPAAVTLDNKVYVFAQNQKLGFWMQVFDPATGKWLFNDAVVVPGGQLYYGSTTRQMDLIAVVATDSRLYLFTFDNDGSLVSTSKQAGQEPSNGWDGRWEKLAGTKAGKIHAANIAGRIYLILPDGRWARLDTTSHSLSWQSSPLKFINGLVHPQNNQHEYIFTHAGGYHADQEGDGDPAAWSPILHIASTEPSQLSSGCYVDARGTTFGADYSQVTGFEDSAGGLFLFYTDYLSGYPPGNVRPGRIQATMRGTDKDGMNGCSTWTGAASMFFSSHFPPAVAPLPEAGAAMLFTVSPSGVIYFHAFDASLDIVPEISTRSSARGYYNADVLSPGRFNVRGPSGSIPGLGGECAPELAVAIHGWTNASDGGQGKFQQAYRGLRALQYPYPVIGLSWPANTNDSFLGIDDALGFDDGKDMADRSSLGFALALQTIKQACPQINIRLISHSLGARVLLKVLQAFNTESALAPWRNAGFKIESIHLMGAAVDNEVPQIDNWGGPGIQKQVVQAYNYYSGDDWVLTHAYSIAEADNALGETGIEERQHAPSNYTDRDLIKEIGSDHYGYWSYLNDDGTVGDVWAIGNDFRDFGPAYGQAKLITTTYQSLLHRLPTGEEYGTAQTYLRAGGTQQGLEPVFITSIFQSILTRPPSGEEYSSTQDYLHSGGTQQGLIGRLTIWLVPLFID